MKLLLIHKIFHKGSRIKKNTTNIVVSFYSKKKAIRVDSLRNLSSFFFFRTKISSLVANYNLASVLTLFTNQVSI